MAAGNRGKTGGGLAGQPQHRTETGAQLKVATQREAAWGSERRAAPTHEATEAPEGPRYPNVHVDLDEHVLLRQNVDAFDAARLVEGAVQNGEQLLWHTVVSERRRGPRGRGRSGREAPERRPQARTGI